MIEDKEMEFLKKFENNFLTALHSDYSRNVMRSDLERMKEIYDREKGTNYNLSFSCGSCQLAFLKHMGKLYYDAKNSRKVVDETEPDMSINKLQKKATSKSKGGKKNGK